MGIIGGIIAGTIISILIAVWALRREHAIHEAALVPEENDADSTSSRHLTLPLEKKLRNAIYDCERNIVACKQEIQSICDNQLDLLKDVGRISHVEVKNKPLFFEFHNPVTGKRHFYFERDLNKEIPPDVLENTQSIAQKYSKQIELLLTQQELFEKLILSHNENLDRINGVNQQNEQIAKINLHKDKLSDLDQNNKIEEEAIYNDLLIAGINEELEHQEECMRQYIELNEKYENPFDEKVEEKYKIEIQEIIKQLENEDPEHPS